MFSYNSIIFNLHTLFSTLFTPLTTCNLWQTCMAHVNVQHVCAQCCLWQDGFCLHAKLAVFDCSGCGSKFNVVSLIVHICKMRRLISLFLAHFRSVLFRTCLLYFHQLRKIMFYENMFSMRPLLLCTLHSSRRDDVACRCWQNNVITASLKQKLGRKINK